MLSTHYALRCDHEDCTATVAGEAWCVTPASHRDTLYAAAALAGWRRVRVQTDGRMIHRDLCPEHKDTEA
jgi:hypothetical protein